MIAAIKHIGLTMLLNSQSIEIAMSVCRLSVALCIVTGRDLSKTESPIDRSTDSVSCDRCVPVKDSFGSGYGNRRLSHRIRLRLLTLLHYQSPTKFLMWVQLVSPYSVQRSYIQHTPNVGHPT